MYFNCSQCDNSVIKLNLMEKLLQETEFKPLTETRMLTLCYNSYLLRQIKCQLMSI